MSDLETLEQKCEELIKEIQALKNKPSKIRGRVPEGDYYWTILSCGRASRRKDYYSSEIDKLRFEIGNYHYTEEEALKKSKKQLTQQRIFDALREHEGDFKYDWKNSDNIKYLLSYTYKDDYFYLIQQSCHQIVADDRWYSSKEACQWVIDNMEDELRIVFDIDQ